MKTNETLRDYEVQRMNYEDLIAEKELLLARLEEIEEEAEQRKKQKGDINLGQIVTLLAECVEDLDMKYDSIQIWCAECDSHIDVRFDELLEAFQEKVR